LGTTQLALTLIVATISYVIINELKKRAKFNDWVTVFALLVFSTFVYLYYQVGWFVYAFFLTLTLYDWTLSLTLLPLALLGLVNGIVTTPLLGGYPVSVRLGDTLGTTILPLSLTYLIGGVASLIGYVLPYLLAFGSNFIAPLLSNVLMIKLSTPLFVVIGSGIMLNMARVKLRKVVNKRKRG
jgi:hypothetical protein